MLNAEKFRKEILEKSNVVSDFFMSKDKHAIKKCLGVCDNCIFYDMGDHCSNAKVKWLLSEYKKPVKLTGFERDILEYALKNTDYRFITRDDEDKLYFYSTKPRKYNRYWQYLAQNQRRLLSDDLFPFVKWEDTEPRVIKDILENCVVIENGL
jgi:hypothetical protein